MAPIAAIGTAFASVVAVSIFSALVNGRKRKTKEHGCEPPLKRVDTLQELQHVS